jgi:hypothetical protein
MPRTVPCPGRGCDESFSSNANLILHLESGACCSGATWQIVTRYAIAVDREYIFVDQQQRTRGSNGASRETQATEESWNGYTYECPLCARVFPKLGQLKAHLRSPVHAKKIYRCPEELDGCTAHFPTLSALLQHIESRTCDVWESQQEIDGFIDSLLSKVKKLRR